MNLEVRLLAESFAASFASDRFRFVPAPSLNQILLFGPETIFERKRFRIIFLFCRPVVNVGIDVDMPLPFRS
jgi:hypothetical protein